MTLVTRTPIFDAVRIMLGRGFKTLEIPALDAAIDEAEGKIVVTAPKKQSEFDSAVIDHLRREEGVRAKAYKDHLGYWTIGVGRLIDKRKGGRITDAEDAILLANDPSRAGKSWHEYVLTDPEINMLLLNDVARFTEAIQEWSAWRKVEGNTARKVALLSMAFQMGHVGLKDFKNSLKLVASGQYEAAADNFMKSLWAKQTPARARRVTQMIATGKL